MREKELYRDTLERMRFIADKYYGGRLTFTTQEAARITGVSAKTLQRKGLHAPITAEQIAKAFC